MLSGRLFSRFVGLFYFFKYYFMTTMWSKIESTKIIIKKVTVQGENGEQNTDPSKK